MMFMVPCKLCSRCSVKPIFIKLRGFVAEKSPPNITYCKNPDIYLALTDIIITVFTPLAGAQMFLRKKNVQASRLNAL